MSLWTMDQPKPAQVVVAQPLYDRVPARAHAALIRCVAQAAMDRTLYAYIEKTGSYIHWARNGLVQSVLAADPSITHLFFADQDVAMPHDAIGRLLARRKPVVGGLYYLKDPERNPCVIGSMDPFAFLPNPVRPGMQQVAGIGMGCTLIEVDVFRKIEQTFTQQNRDSANLWFALVSGGEDTWFSLRCHALGIPIFLDADVLCEHIGDFGYIAPDAPRPDAPQLALAPTAEGLRE